MHTGVPTVLLPYWALGAEPVDLLAAFQADLVWVVPVTGIASVIPLRQERVLALSKGWVLCHPLGLGLGIGTALWAASFLFASSGVASHLQPQTRQCQLAN